MTLNTKLLSTLVTWAASDELRHTDPERAVQLGISKEDDPLLGRWRQDSWGRAERNGFCHTAYCMAGGAVHLQEDLLPVMSTDNAHDAGDFGWGAEYVMRVNQVPEELEGAVKWNILWVTTDELFNLVDHGLTTRIHGAAEELLGLAPSESAWLFDGSNDISKVVSYAVGIADHADEDLDMPDWVTDAFVDEFFIKQMNKYVYGLVEV